MILRKKHTSARRNVLFNDDSLDLVLDFSLEEGAPWKRITAKQARAKMAKKKKTERHMGESWECGPLTTMRRAWTRKTIWVPRPGRTLGSPTTALTPSPSNLTETTTISLTRSKLKKRKTRKVTN